jgi:hypothetical protein
LDIWALVAGIGGILIGLGIGFKVATAPHRAKSHPPVDPKLCATCGFRGTPLCTHPDGVYQDEPAGLNKLKGR